MAQTFTVLPRGKRIGFQSSGSVLVNANASETAIKATADISVADLAKAKSAQVVLQVQDPDSLEWSSVAFFNWSGPVDPRVPPSLRTNLVPHRGKRVRVTIDTIEDLDAELVVELQD